MAPRWNPWRALRQRPTTTLAWARLVGDVGLVEVTLDRNGRVCDETILIDLRLGRRERRAVLAHELVHLERGLLPAGAPAAVVAREEHQVRAETVARLVPPAELTRFVESRAGVGPVTVADVADEFDVPAATADAALRRLLADTGGRSGGRGGDDPSGG